MFRYRLHLEDGSDVGQATYPSVVKVGEKLFFGNGRSFRVLDVVPFAEEDESEFVAMGSWSNQLDCEDRGSQMHHSGYERRPLQPVQKRPEAAAVSRLPRRAGGHPRRTELLLPDRLVAPQRGGASCQRAMPARGRRGRSGSSR